MVTSNSTRLFRIPALNSHAMKALLAALFLSAIVGCGGNVKTVQAAPSPTPNPVIASATPTPFPTPVPVKDQVTITADSVMNMGMIGQTWTFQNSFGEMNTFTIEAVPDGVACHGGNNLAIHMTKTTAHTYWGLGIDQAEVWSVLHQNDDGSWRFISNLLNFPSGCPWCGNGPVAITSEVVDNQPSLPLPYLIAPPTTSTGDNFINETRVTGLNTDGLNYTCNIPSDTPLTGLGDGEYFRTDFYLAEVTTPAYSGPAVVSDQYEADCGHERWYFAPGKGIVEIESLNDGGQTKLNPGCRGTFSYQFSTPAFTIKRIN